MTNKRILSTLLALAILLSCVGWTPVQAQEVASVEENIDTAAQIADNSNISQFVDMEQFKQADHVARLRDEEKLNTYVFRNRDGSKSVYYMDQDVKFVDDGGTIREKDTTLVRGEKGYGVRSNDVGLHIPDSAVDGITVSYNSCDVKLTPNGGSGNAVISDNSVVYSDFFGRGIHLKYTPMLSGVKEDVIITKYTGINSFSFTLETGGLYLYETDGRYYLAAGKDAEVAFYLGEVLVYDAIGRPDLGTMTVETITAGQRYKLTVSANEAFLTDPETLYPVTIDPTLTVSDNTHGAGAIEDAPVFDGKPTKNFGSYVYNTIGYHSESYGTAMTVVRLTGLLADETYSALSVSDISNVTFYMKDGGSSSATVNIHAISSNSTWTESGVTYENLGSYSTTVTATDTMGSGSWGEFDITTLAKGWKSTAVNGQCGFVMVIGDSTKKVGTLSSEYSNTDYRPYVVVTYTGSELAVDEGSTLQLTTSMIGTINWSSSDESLATVSSSGLVTGVKAGEVTITAACGDYGFSTYKVYVTVPDGVYYVKNLNSNYYLHVKSGGIDNLTDVYQYSKYTDTTTASYRIRQMWKLCYLGNGRYSIRPMHKLDMGLDVTGGNVDIYDIGATDTLASVPSCGEWTIDWYLSGYVFKNNGNNSTTMQIKDAATTLGATAVASAYSTNLNCRWEMTKVSSPPSGLLLYSASTGSITTNPTKTVNPQDTVSLSQLNLEVTVYSGTTNSQSVYWYSSNTNVVTVNSSSGSVTGVSPGTATITARKYLDGMYYYVSYNVKVNNNAVIIIPGIMGTELIAGSNNSSYAYGTKLWSTDLIDDYESGELGASEVVEMLVSLRCDTAGDTINDIIPYNNTYGAGNTYKYLYDSLCDEYQDEYSIKFFAYDWRLSNSVSANKLNEFINYYDYDNVVLVCHSMGGLVASGYLSLGSTQRTKVETVITLGSPLLGTSVVPYLWGSEDVNVTGLLDSLGIPDWSVKLIDLVALFYDPLDYLMGNFSSMYEMFPTEKYFDSSFAGRSYLVTSFAGTADETITTYADTRIRLDSYLAHFNADLADNAELFHDSLYINNDHVTSLVKTYYIAGYGFQTVNMVEFNMWDWYVYSYTYNGDELVAEWSATLGDKYSNRTFYVEDVGHMGLVSNTNVRQFVIQLIAGNATTTPFSNIHTDIV